MRRPSSVNLAPDRIKHTLSVFTLVAFRTMRVPCLRDVIRHSRKGFAQLYPAALEALFMCRSANASSVHFCVFSLRSNQRKVLDIIIQFVTVFMVNNFIRLKNTAKMAFHHQTVGAHFLTINTHYPITKRKPPAAFPIRIETSSFATRLTTKLPTLLSTKKACVMTNEFSSTIKAFKNHSWLWYASEHAKSSVL